jgi:pimeloyl-ACP methyl ester carboxylesterase
MRNQPGHGKRLSYYDFGRTTVYACAFDQRFSYCAYVPESYEEEGTQRYPLLVAVHGTARDMIGNRNAFADFAERHQAIVLAPLFPAGITAPGELSSYKMVQPGPVRYDAVLLAMVEEMGARYRLADSRFALFGFSGGGHFAHRFLYLHPERLAAVSIGAPGVVTLLDLTHDFWVGLRDFERVFGRQLDLAAMRRVAVHMVVGGDDTETWEITIEPGNELWMPGADKAGRNRQERLLALKTSLEAHGIAVRHDVVPGVAHRSDGLMPAIERFFDDVFAGWPAGERRRTAG